MDYCNSLATIYQRIQEMQSAVTAGDSERIEQIAKETDWAVLADEFESVVGRYKSEVRRHSQKLIRNLRRPYIIYHDCIQAAFHREMIVGAIKDSPSLRAVADQQITDAWERDVDRYSLKGRQSQETKPIKSLTDLYLAAKWKIDLGRKLEWEHKGFMNGQRVPYADLVLP